jgi:circadian clock protein KaiB
MTKYILKLFVNADHPRSKSAIENLRQICESELKGRYELVIVDVMQEPERAEEDQVMTTPTLVMELPGPLRTVIGDLGDKEKVLKGLQVVVAETDR